MAGFFNKAWTGIQDVGIGIADASTAEFAPNLITSDDYSDTGFGKGIAEGQAFYAGLSAASPLAKLSQQVNPTDPYKGMSKSDISAYDRAVPIGRAGNTIGEAFLGGGLAGSKNGAQPIPQQIPQSTQPPNPYYNATNTTPQMSYADSYAYGGYVKGRIRGYAGGGIIEEQDTTVFQPTELNKQIGYGNYGYDPNTGGQPEQYLAKASGLNPYIAAGTLGLGALQTIQGYRGLNKLQKEAMPTYGVSSQLNQAYQKAQQMANRGYTPEQEAAFKRNLAIIQNTAYRNAISQSGGNLAQAVNAGLQSQNIGALNQFAADDAAKRQQNIQYADSFAPRFQNIQDENTRNALNYRIMREQALGNAISQGQTNLATGLNAGLASTYKG